MSGLKRALTFNNARDKGLVHGDYIFKGLPEEFVGKLEYKVWGKYMNLLLYFQSDDKRKYLLSIYRNRGGSKYAPRNMPDFDLSDTSIHPGMKFRVVTKLTKSGNSDLFEAELL